MRKAVVLTMSLMTVLSCMGQQLTFCGELVPIEREQVEKGLLLALKQQYRDMFNTKLQQKAALYLPFITFVLQQYGLPEDLKYLAITESRLNRHAVSPAGAAGMWQFMPATAAAEGLRIGGGIDERGRVIKSTHAACRLLSKLYQQLGSWALVAAAYNLGIGNLQKTMIRQGSRDYYALQLNPETGRYVYNILAFKLLYQSMSDKDSSAEMQLLAQPMRPLQKMDIIIKEAQDTTTVTAKLLQDSHLDGGMLAFITTEPGQVGNFQLPRQTVIKSFVYQLTNRVLINGAGVEVAPELGAYTIAIYKDGQEGIPVPGKKKIILPAGYSVQLKFFKDCYE